MQSYLYKRLLGVVPLLLFVTFGAFVLINLRTSDPAEVALRVNQIPPTPEVVEQMRLELGLDRPYFVRYFSWLGNSLTGNFGNSFVNGKAVEAELFQALPPTLKLAGVTLLIIVFLSITLGILCSLFENRWPDRLLRGIVFVFSGMPSFWVGLIFIWFFAVKLGWFPTSGMTSPTSVVLPAMTLSLTYLSTYVRLIRNNMIRNQHENYILYSRVRGLPKSVITRDLFFNSLHSSLTAFGMSIPKLIAGTVVVENVFAWPGVGRLCVTAIFNSDYPIIQAYIFITATLFILCNLVVDVVLMLADPRLRRAV